MNKVLLIGFHISLLLLSCGKKESSVDESRSDCQLKINITAPFGYEINCVSEVDIKRNVRAFQFVNDQIGYALLGFGFGAISKTTDGGKSWTKLKEVNQSPIGMVFKDKNIGIVSVLDITGCPPPNCKNKCVIYKTINGGLQWIEKEIVGLNGVLYHPKYDSDGNLYALLTLENEYKLLKSTDDGETWSPFFVSPDLGFQLVTFSFEIFMDQFYVSGKNGKILVVNKNGELVQTLEVGSSSIWDVEIIDENNIVVALSEKVIKTIDGGKNWQTIYNKNARIIGFDSPDKGLMLGNRSSSGTDVYLENDMIISTTDGGKQWIEAEKTTTNMRSDFNYSQKMANGNWFLMLQTKLYEIKEK